MPGDVVGANQNAPLPDPHQPVTSATPERRERGLPGPCRPARGVAVAPRECPAAAGEHLQCQWRRDLVTLRLLSTAQGDASSSIPLLLRPWSMLPAPDARGACNLNTISTVRNNRHAIQRVGVFSMLRALSFSVVTNARGKVRSRSPCGTRASHCASTTPWLGSHNSGAIEALQLLGRYQPLPQKPSRSAAVPRRAVSGQAQVSEQFKARPQQRR